MDEQPPTMHRDPALVTAWTTAGLDAAPLLGVAAAVGAGDASRAAVTVVTAEPLPEEHLAGAASALAGALGVQTVDVIPAHGSTLRHVVREWVFRAAHGSGRGVDVQLGLLRADDVASARLQVRLSSWDSSAREVLLRLSSPDEPALASLAAVLPYAGIEVVEIEA